MPSSLPAGKLEAFAARSRIVHIDIDPAEIDKNKEAHIPVCSDIKPALQMLNRMLAEAPLDLSGVSGKRYTWGAVIRRQWQAGWQRRRQQ